MDIDKTIKRINKGRNEIEGSFVFCLWKDPQLYDEYYGLNDRDNEFLKTKDAKFFYALGQKLYDAGYRNFDALTLEAYTSGKETVRKHIDEYGGYAEISKFKTLADPENIDGYFDQIVRQNMLTQYAKQTNDIFDDIGRFDNASPQDVYDAFELMNSQVDLEQHNSEGIEVLSIDEKYIQECDEGQEVGLSYSATAPILSYITLGVNPGMTLIGGQSGVGKSTFGFEIYIMGLIKTGYTCAILSNEQNIKAFKHLLLVHILVNDLNVWNIPRKKLKMGNFTDEQKEILRKAIAIYNEKYKDKIFFVKMFDNSIPKVIKYLKKLKNKHNITCCLYDTFKSDDNATVGEQMWQELLITSRRLFQACDKMGICLITTYQLAPAKINQRYLDVGCLSNSKAIKSVYSDMVYMRPIWQDEYKDERYDVKPYRYEKPKEGGKRIKTYFDLDPDKKYIILFCDKTRSDEDKQTLIYQWDGYAAHYRELGYCTVRNDHKTY